MYQITEYITKELLLLLVLLFAIVVVNVVIGVRAGGGGQLGRGKLQPPPLKMFLKFVGLNADYSDKSTPEKSC